MRAVVLEGYGGPEVLHLREIPDPEPGRGEVRVAVEATALNRADVLQRLGKYPPPGPKPVFEVPGLEFAGRVEQLGPEVAEWKVGDRVFGLLAGGGYAERVVAHERMLLPVPPGVRWVEAAAIPEAYFTAWDALVDRAGLRPGETLLVHAAAGGVGTAALQLARILGAGALWATTRTPAKGERLKREGLADEVVVASEAQEIARAVVERTNGRGADVIFDFVGGPYLEANVAMAATGGRIIGLSYLGGARGTLPLGALLFKRLTLVGTTLRGRPIEEKMLLTQRFRREVLPHVASGRVRPILDRVVPLEAIAEAHRLMEENRTFGKVAVRIGREEE